MKNFNPTFFLCVIFGNILLHAQFSPVQFKYQDFGYHQQPEKVEIKRYSYEKGNPILIETETQIFNQYGHIKSITTIFHEENDGQKTTTKYTYENGLPKYEATKNTVWRNLNNTSVFFWNDKKRIEQWENYADGHEEIRNFFYNKSGELYTVEGTINGEKIKETYSDNHFGETYLITAAHHIAPGESNFSTQLFHKGNPVAEYMNKGTHIFIQAVSEDFDIKFSAKNDDLVLPELEKFQHHLYSDESTTNEMNQKLLKWGRDENKFKIFSQTYFQRNQFGDLMSSAKMDFPFSGDVYFEFYTFHYADGTISQNDFEEEKVNFYKQKAETILKKQ